MVGLKDYFGLITSQEYDYPHFYEYILFFINKTFFTFEDNSKRTTLAFYLDVMNIYDFALPN